jgi:hypothetical protein
MMPALGSIRPSDHQEVLKLHTVMQYRPRHAHHIQIPPASSPQLTCCTHLDVWPRLPIVDDPVWPTECFAFISELQPSACCKRDNDGSYVMLTRFAAKLVRYHGRCTAMNACQAMNGASALQRVAARRLQPVATQTIGTHLPPTSVHVSSSRCVFLVYTKAHHKWLCPCS